MQPQSVTSVVLSQARRASMTLAPVREAVELLLTFALNVRGPFEFNLRCEGGRLVWALKARGSGLCTRLDAADPYGAAMALHRRREAEMAGELERARQTALRAERIVRA